MENFLKHELHGVLRRFDGIGNGRDADGDERSVQALGGVREAQTYSDGREGAEVVFIVLVENGLGRVYEFLARDEAGVGVFGLLVAQFAEVERVDGLALGELRADVLGEATPDLVKEP